MGRWVVAMLVAMASAASARADDLARWLAATEAKAVAWADLGGIHFRYRIELRLHQSPEEIARLRRDGESAPLTPMGAEWATVQRLLRGETVAQHFDLVIDSDRRWRSSILIDGHYSDDAINGAVGWSLMPGTLRVHSIADGPRYQGEISPAHAASSMHPHVRQMLWGFLGQSQMLPNSRLLPPERSGNAWRAVMRTQPPEGAGPPFEMTYEGVWDDATKAGRVLKATITASATRPDTVGLSWEFLDHAPIEGTDLVCARRVIERTPAGEPARELIIERAEKFTAEQVDAALATPRPGGMDSVRGELGRDLRVVDYIVGEERGSVMPGQAVSFVPVERPVRPFRFLGWAVLVLVAGSMVIVIARRCSTTSQEASR